MIQVATALAADADAGIATLATPVTSRAEANDPNVVKVVCDATGRALYFSRASIPFDRDGAGKRREGMSRHIGLYAYRVAALRRLAALEPAPPERVEHLEQLRALWYGIPIVVARATDAPPQGVDTREDLERVRGLLDA